MFLNWYRYTTSISFFLKFFPLRGIFKVTPGHSIMSNRSRMQQKHFLKRWVRVTSDCLLCLIISNYSVYSFLVSSIAGHADSTCCTVSKLLFHYAYNSQLCLITKLGKSCIIACLLLLKWTQFSSLKNTS